jgi:hypothetical protein
MEAAPLVAIATERDAKQSILTQVSHVAAGEGDSDPDLRRLPRPFGSMSAGTG